jgi:inositol phosphorylceramide mannosyltransferase catalytic subunit
MTESFENIIRRSWGFVQAQYNSDPRWDIVKELYEKNFIHVNSRNYDVMPKKIHQIWLGGELPDKYKRWGETWTKFNPDWEYKLWTDNDVEKVNISDRVKFNSIRNLGQKSDYLRYHILNQFGGLYVDTDFECLKSFNPLTYANFLVGVGYPSKVELYIGLMGSVPNHPVLLYLLNIMNKNYIDSKDIFNTTGTYFFTKIFFEIVRGYMNGVVILPPDYFYPFPNHKGHELENGRDYILDCSYAVHHWEISWSNKKQNVSK